MAVVAGDRGLLGLEFLVEFLVAADAVVVEGLAVVLELLLLVELGRILALGGLAAFLVAFDAGLDLAVGLQTGDGFALVVMMAVTATVG